MAENDMGDKTEAPTPRRRQEARDAGNFARSPDLIASALLVCILILLRWYGLNLMASLRNLLEAMLSAPSMQDVRGVILFQEVVRAVIDIGFASAPLFAGILVVAVGLNLVQTGFYFNLTRIQPNFMGLNPVKGIGRLFSFQGPSFVRLGTNILKLVLVGWAAWSAIDTKLGSIVHVQQLEFGQIFALGAGVVYDIAMRIGMVLLMLALADYAYQKYQIEQNLKMSKAEVKEEMKAHEGDPRVKVHRKQMAFQRARERLKRNVPKAKVVVTNPTHYAVALDYEPTKMNAPIVVAKGAGVLAARIRELAVENGIPIVERAPLARAIYRMVPVGRAIPEEFYSAVAEILAYVYQITGKKPPANATPVAAPAGF
jgi:flagellar biosynthetic protein FlhB